MKFLVAQNGVENYRCDDYPKLRKDEVCFFIDPDESEKDLQKRLKKGQVHTAATAAEWAKQKNNDSDNNDAGGSIGYALFTTGKIPVNANRMLLPNKPIGALVLNLAMVYDSTGVVTYYDGVTVAQINGQSYAQLNEPEPVTGWGVMSYLIKEAV